MRFNRDRCRLYSCAVLIAVASMLFAGCIFTPREAEAPASDSGSSWTVPDNPTKVFVNMTSGLESLTGANYEKSLGAAFTFIPLPSDADQFPGAFDGWNKTREMQVMNTVIGDAKTLVVVFSDLVQKEGSTSSAQYEGRYELSIVNKTAPDTLVYKGKARFDLQEGSKGWELIKWEDFESVTGFASWGFLRGTLSS
jgi:hypothetical protein